MTTRRPRRRPGENRRRLVEAGLVEFGLYGYHGASTAAIARRAGVPQPHVYANFTTKQELFLACCERAAHELRMRLLGGAESSDAGAGDVTGRPGAVADDDVVTASLVRFWYQAIAVSRDPRLAPQLQPLLSSLQTSLGETRVRAILLEAATDLLRSPQL